MSAAPKPFLNSLQALRFCAALMVLVYHTELELMRRAFPSSMPLVDVTRINWAVGVDVFFIVSGFIMYYLTASRFEVRGEARDFLTRRVVRVVPLYWIFTSLYVLIMLASPSSVRQAELDLAHVVASYLFLPWPNAQQHIYPVFTLGWTLNYEMFFYVLFSLGLVLPRRRGLALVLGSLAALVLLGLLTPRPLFVLRFFTRPIILEFGFGILLAYAYLRGVRLSSATRFALLAAGAAALVIFGHMGWEDHWYRPVWAGLPCAALAAGAILGPDLRDASRVGRSLVVLGGASYSLYLTHMFVIRALSVVWSRLHLQGGWFFLLAAVVGCTVVALASYYLIEQPLLRLFRRASIGASAPELHPSRA